MASLTACASGSIVRPAKAASSSGRVATNGVSSLRFKPFTKLSLKGLLGRQQSGLRTKAAAPEAPVAEDLDFEFNYNDSKKNNEYSAGDVEAALRFYSAGEGVEPVYDQDHVTNYFGTEDASFFDDIDNNEAYEADEYVVAGIPEAAPKKRGRGRRGDGVADGDEVDDIDQAKVLDKMKAMEDQMILQAAMEEEFGADFNKDKQQATVEATRAGMWDWLTDYDESVDDAAIMDTTNITSIKRSTAKLASDADVLAGLGNVNIEELDQETRDLLELVVGEGDLTEDELKRLSAEDEGADLPEAETENADDAARLSALVTAELPKLDVDVAEVPITWRGADVDEPELDQQAMQEYIASLKAAAEADSNLTEDEVKAMFADAGEAVEVEAPEEAYDDPEEAALLSAPEPTLPSADVDLHFDVSELAITVDEEASYDTTDIERELVSLAEMEDPTADDFPTPEQLDMLDQYVTAASEYVAQEEQRKQQIAAAVARGEMSADALAEELEEVPDMEADLLEDFEEVDSDVIMYDDDDDGIQWQERILELTRVTKVVKGGKLMGFRCVAIVGNENGLVGVGCQSGRDVASAVKRTLVDAKKNIVQVPLVGAGTTPHKSEAKYHSARVIVVPASDGTGVIAGGSIRSVLELAGVKNVLAKRLASRSPLNNARATVKALQQLKTLNEVSRARGVPMEQLLLPANA